MENDSSSQPNPQRMFEHPRNYPVRSPRTMPSDSLSLTWRNGAIVITDPTQPDTALTETTRKSYLNLEGLGLTTETLSTILNSIPEGERPYIKAIYLGHNKIEHLPDEIELLAELAELYIYDNPLRSISGKIGKLHKLWIMYILNNKLESLPDEIGDMDGLRLIYAEYNELRSVPASLGKLCELEQLDLRFSPELKRLPSELKSLRKLKELYLSSNKITRFPYAIKGMVSLKILFIRSNQLRIIPRWINKLQALQELMLDDNQITFIPPEIGNLTKLTMLALPYNQLLSIPPEIGHLHELVRFSFSNNSELTDVPDTIWNCKKLQGINFRGTKVGGGTDNNYRQLLGRTDRALCNG